MEKKNTILLTVIAIATLLVAVVGATFAYFTASVTTTNENPTTTVNTKKMASATMKVSGDVDPKEAYPGFKMVRTIDVDGAGSAGDVGIQARITITPTIDASFGDTIKYAIYKVSNDDGTTKKTPVTCGTPEYKTMPKTVTEGETTKDITAHYMDTTCDVPSGVEVMTGKSGSFSNGTSVTIDVDIEYNTHDTYYVYVEYENKDEAQNSQSGKTFKVEITAKEVVKTVPTT